MGGGKRTKVTKLKFITGVDRERKKISVDRKCKKVEGANEKTHLVPVR